MAEGVLCQRLLYKDLSVSLIERIDHLLVDDSSIHTIFKFETGDDLLEFHQAVVSTLRDSDDAPEPAPLPPNVQHNPLATHTNEDMARLCENTQDLDNNQNDDEVDNSKYMIRSYQHR